MLIGIVGPACSGKQTVARLLVEREGFRQLSIQSAKNATASSSLKKEHHQEGEPSVFANANELLAFVTTRWQERFVVCAVESIVTVELLQHRPFFLLIAIDAPVLLRYQRWINKYEKHGTLEQFLEYDDRIRFSGSNVEAMTEKGASVLCPISPTVQLARMADIHIDNIYHDVDKLFMQMTRLRITDAERLRPSWDSYFMLLADLAARRSNCMKRRVGCIIVCDRRVLATGYNGTPRGILNCNKGGCERCNRGSTRGTALDECICLHAEENAIMELGVSRVQNNTTLYCNTYPCLGCAKRIVQVGIREVVYYHTYGTNKTTIALFEAAGVYTRRHHPMAPHHSFIEDDSMS